ncbi:ErfK/YbiS/YcfS/YnhG family protein [Lysobacter dokdonensis DS-58]|uniref:ErfK/YbiS/YcfS/YnhG family protein n=1 Tax=Lysobacter dokdonensis DS-58 TaxID=1300345 RepID=A0A0A2WY10_9GAMM|nr:L,D-transpeptidase family protein [Lysobacter dokdonensis]KGQ17929.1 ErfK/YbiS/YcfS/YnhG family protein [Lysobacter dokdonensis DS-58]
MRVAFVALAALCIGAAQARTVYADKILVDKSERRLWVFVDGKTVATYRIGLGLAPVGHKQREGDKKTPEGLYVLDYKNAGSAFYRSIHISYPNADDRARAKRQGVPPGGAIMIHGQANDPRIRAAVAIYPSRDWTDGCISLSNADMLALWKQVKVPVPIEIRP